jgi:hypothetical protein
MNITETPEKWVVLKLPDNSYKVFGTWGGGYLDGSRWKLNSGVKEVKEDTDFYYFIGHSGSCYKCHKKSYGISTLYNETVLSNFIEKTNSLSLMGENSDWLNLT